MNASKREELKVSLILFVTGLLLCGAALGFFTR